VTIPMHVTALVAGLAGLFATTSCGGSAASACELAHHKLKECDVPVLRPSTIGAILLPLAGGTPEDCTDQNRCVAQCVTDASCEAITFVVAGGATDPNVTIPAGSEGFQRCLYCCL
jgi:hypothetical protein